MIIGIMILALLIISHSIAIFIFNFIINPYDPSTFTKIFPYQFIYNLIFSKFKPKDSYFSLRVDINSSKENVKKHDQGVLELIKIANEYSIPITFSLVADFLPELSDEVIEMIKEGDHEVISHGLDHEDITEQDQVNSIRRSKELLEDTFDQEILGFIGPKGRHDLKTLEAAKESRIKFLSSGYLPHLRYWSFPYPFKKRGIWLLGGSIKSDHRLYEEQKLKPEKALKIWKEELDFRAERGWYTQLEYHNFSTSEEKLKALEELFEHIEKKDDLKPITQSDLIREVK